MKSCFIVLLLALNFVWSSNLPETASPQVEARIIEEWSACSEFCVDSCKTRFGIDQYSLCFEYACGCKVLEQEKEEPEVAASEEKEEILDEATEAVVLPSDGTEFEVINSTSVMLMMSVGVILVWIIGIIAWNSIKPNTKEEQPEYLVLDDNDHYQRLF